MAPPLYDHFLQTCRDAGYLPAAIVHARNQHFTHGLILAGRGVHFNEEPWTELPAGIVWRPLEEATLAWRTSALWLKSRRSAETDAFVEAVGAGLKPAGIPRRTAPLTHVPADHFRLPTGPQGPFLSTILSGGIGGNQPNRPHNKEDRNGFG